MRIIVLILAVLVAGAFLLFDTAALAQLGWLCLTGRCGVPSTWILAGLGVLLLACVLPGMLARLRRRRKKPARGKPPRPARRPRKP